MAAEPSLQPSPSLCLFKYGLCAKNLLLKPSCRNDVPFHLELTCLHSKTFHPDVSFCILSYSVLSSYIDLQKDSTMNLNIPQTLGQPGLTSSPPRKFLPQHSPQKQENDPDQTQGQHGCLANGVVAAQNQMECEDEKETTLSPEMAIQTAAASPDTHVLNGERNETITDSASSIANSHDENASDSSCRTPGTDLGLPSKEGEPGMDAELQERENGVNTMGLDTLDQHHEVKVNCKPSQCRASTT